MVDPIGIHWLKIVGLFTTSQTQRDVRARRGIQCRSVQLMMHGGDGMAVQAMVSLDGTMSSVGAEPSTRSGSKDSLDEMTGD